MQLLERFAQDDRIRIRQPRRNLQAKLRRQLPDGNDFVAYIDALGYLDSTRCLIEWKPPAAATRRSPRACWDLNPQLVCYSWVSGMAEVALVAFVRKRLPKIQYLRTSISEKQRLEFAQLVDQSIRQIEAGYFLPHSGIRFPQNDCLSCPYLGLCLDRPELVQARLYRRPEASHFAWLDQLEG